MARHDRLHARPPAHDSDRWTEGEVVAASHDDAGVVVTVRDGGGQVDLRVSEAVYDLFVGRVAPEHRADGEVRPGAPVWYRKRGEG
jgi:hypothetical protein